MAKLNRVAKMVQKDSVIDEATLRIDQCENPFPHKRSQCSTKIELAIVVKGEQFWICSECWRKITDPTHEKNFRFSNPDKIPISEYEEVT